MLGAKHVDERSQRAKHESCTDLFGASSQWRLSFSTTLSRTMYPGLPESHQEASSNPYIGKILGPPIRKFQADAEGAENHAYNFLGPQRRHLYEIPAESYCERLKKLLRAVHN
jgi:hypothetical protein